MATPARRSLFNRRGVADLLERSACSIIRDRPEPFWIAMTADELPQMRDIRRGPFEMVEGAMAAIAKKRHGPCRHRAATASTRHVP